MRTRRVDIGDLELEVFEAGEGGRPLVLMHGFTGAKEDFEDWVDDLGVAGWHVVVPDTRGHGSSDKPEGPDAYSLDLFAADTLSLADAMGFDRFTLLGHSMGGMFVQVAALKAPERVHALVLMDTHHGALSTIDPNLVDLGAQTALGEGMDVVADFVAEMGENDPLVTEAHRALVERRPERKVQSDRNLRVASPWMYASMLRVIATGEDRLDRLVELTMPTLVIVGEQDAPFLAASRRMAETIPNARLALIPDAGHSPQLETPTAWWDALSGFLAEVG